MPDPNPRWRSLPVVVAIGLLVSWLSLIAIAISIGGLLIATGNADWSSEMNGTLVAAMVAGIAVAFFFALLVGGFVATRLYGDSLPHPSVGVGLSATAVVTLGVWYQQGHFEPVGLFALLVIFVPGAIAGGLLESRRAA